MKPWKCLFLCVLLGLAARAEELRLKDGTVLKGERAGVADDTLLFRTRLGDLRVPVSEVRPGAWTYNEDPMRIGRLFTMTTERYQLRGVITWVGDVKPSAAGAAP